MACHSKIAIINQIEISSTSLCPKYVLLMFLESACFLEIQMSSRSQCVVEAVMNKKKDDFDDE